MKRAQLVFVVLIIATSTVGAIWSWKDFLQSMLAEATGIMIGILIATLILDQISKREERKKNDRILSAIYYRLDHLLEDFVYLHWSYFISLPEGLSGKIEFGEPYGTIAEIAKIEEGEILAKMGSFPTVLIRRDLGGGTLTVSKKDESIIYFSDPGQIRSFRREFEKARGDLASSKGLYGKLESCLDCLRGDLIPRALYISNDPTVAESLMEAEKLWINWRKTMETVEDDWGMPEEYAWESFFELVRQLAKIQEMSFDFKK